MADIPVGSFSVKVNDVTYIVRVVDRKGQLVMLPLKVLPGIY